MKNYNTQFFYSHIKPNMAILQKYFSRVSFNRSDVLLKNKFFHHLFFHFLKSFAYCNNLSLFTWQEFFFILLAKTNILKHDTKLTLNLIK